MAGKSNRAQSRSAPERQRAREFLRRELYAGPLPQNEIAARAQEAGISAASLKRVRADLGVHAEKHGFGPAGIWLLALGTAGGTAQQGEPGAGWGLLAGGAASLGLAWVCISANRKAAAEGGCGAFSFSGYPPPPGAQHKDCCPKWLIFVLILAGVALAILGLQRM